MMKNAGVLLLALAVGACGGGSSSPRTPVSPPPSPPDVPPSIGTTTGRLVSSLNSNEPIGGAAVRNDVLGETTSNADGYFMLQASVSAAYNVRISNVSWIERQTILKVPGGEATVSLIPGSFNLTYFDEMCRGLGGGIARWETAPTLFVETAIIQYGSRVATNEDVPDDVVQRTMAEMRQVLPVLTAGRYPEYAAIEVRRTPEGTRSDIPQGAVALTWQKGLLQGFGHVAYGYRGFGGPGLALNRGEVGLDHEWHVSRPSNMRRDYFEVVQHELGHALGYSHTKTAPSFMYEVFLMTVSALDRQAFEIYMQRPSGNRSPDVDPTGTSMNLMDLPEEAFRPRCSFLRRN